MGCVGGRQALYFSHIYSYDQSVAQHKAIFTALRLTETNVGGDNLYDSFHKKLDCVVDTSTISPLLLPINITPNILFLTHARY